MKTELYFESHVTIEPLDDDVKITAFTEICHKHSFRPAKLFMQKRKSDAEERSKYDAFCTSRSEKYISISANTIGLVVDLQKAGFTVWRYKIENTILDSKIEDIFSLL